MAYDVDTETLIAVAGVFEAKEISCVPALHRHIMDRCQAFRAGRSQAPAWANKMLQRVYPNLYLRWSFDEQCYVVDRYSTDLRAWVPVLIWKDELGKPKSLSYDLVLTLQQGDMWRFSSPKEYLRHKRRQSAAIRERNRKAGDEKILEAVDKLSTKRIQNFIEVEQALKTGETVILEGDALKSFERMQEGAKKQAAAETAKGA